MFKFFTLNILFLANRFPYPPYRGDKLKIFNLTKRLSKNHKLILLSFYEKKEELHYLKELEPYFTHIELVYLPKWKSVLNCIPALFTNTPLQLAYFKSYKMHKALAGLLTKHNIDVVHTQHLRMSQYTKNVEVPKVLDLPDAFSLYWKRRRDTDRKWYLRIVDQIEISRLVKAEAVINQYNLCLVCSLEDKTYLEKVHKSSKIDLLLNGVDLDTFSVGEGHDYNLENILLFTGNMDYAPNVDAVIYFTREIWPVLKRLHPELKFIIAGQRPVIAVQKLAGDDIKVTGFIPKLQEMYSNATILVAPLRFGAGTQNKVLEAMAMGLPVVCTKIGFEGLGIESGEGVLLGKDDQQFIAHTSKLLLDSEYRATVGNRGLEKARSRFSWDVVAKDLEAHFQSVLKK